MNLNLMNGRIKKNSESVKEIWEAIEALKKGAPVPTPVAVPTGGDVDIS